MCKAIEDMRNEAAKEKSISAARKILKAGKFSYEEIAEYLDLTVDEVKELAAKQPA